MKHSIYGVTEEEVFRLVCAYVAIRKPAIRKEFIRTLESWATEQWHIIDNRDNQNDKAP